MIKNPLVHVTYQILIIIIASNTPYIALPGIVWLCPLTLIVFALYSKIKHVSHDLLKTAEDSENGNV